MEPFELSLSPYFNDVIRAAQQCATDPDEAARQALAEQLSSMAEFTQVLTKTFSSAMKVRPKTSLTKAAPQRFEKALAALTEAMRVLKQCTKAPDTQALAAGVAKGRQAIADMFGLFEDMRREEESFPVFSESPYIQELVRIATGVAKGEYGADTLKAKLEWMQNRYREFAADFASLKDSPRETEEVDKLLPVAEKALAEMGRALAEMNTFMKDRNRDHLKQGCANLLQASEILIAVQARLMKITTAQPAACPKCAAINPGGAKTCHKCGANLPEIVGLATQTVEVKENFSTNERPTFTYLARLEGAVESALTGAIAKEELAKQIRFFASKAKAGRAQFEALKMPDSFDSDQAKKLSQQSYRLMDKGTQATLDGVTKMEKYLSSDERTCLEEGLSEVQQGADCIISAQQIVLASGVTPP